MTGRLETGYQTTLPKPRRPVKSAPISSQSEWRASVFRGADGEQALGIGRDGAGVGGVELKGCAGSERRGERNGGLVQLAGVVGVGVERGDRERWRRGRRCECAPS